MPIHYLKNEDIEQMLERFVSYVKIHTTSAYGVDEIPSTARQWELAKLLRTELEQIGLVDVSLDENGYVMGFLPTNVTREVPSIGFIAHYDTSPDFSGEHVQPKIWRNYQGDDLKLNEQRTLSPRQFPELKNYIGQTIITTSGDTLLGADDKAGVIAIISAMKYIVDHPEIPHGKIGVCFTPDEEVGRGAERFDVAKFGMDWAYTIDGGEIGELEFENFNAAMAMIEVDGVSVHPGFAYGIMKNAALIASEIAQSFPSNETPSTTKDYQGFYHLTSLEGTVEKAKLQYIIRDHDDQKFEDRKLFVQQLVQLFQQKYGANSICLTLRDQYYNMRKMIEDKPYIVDIAKRAMEEVGVQPKIKAIRGGTDGAQLSYKGLPCPNIFAGGHNFHGPYEFVPLESIAKATETIIRIVELAVKI